MARAANRRVSRFPAISVRQPAADLIVRGEKRDDVRSRPTRFRGWILVHASRTVARDGLSKATTAASELERGKLVGMVRLDDCAGANGAWTYSWKSPKRFRTAIPCRGHYSIPFYVPMTLLRGTLAEKVTPGKLED